MKLINRYGKHIANIDVYKLNPRTLRELLALGYKLEKPDER